MGLIKAITNAVGGATADQWREFFYCDSMPNDMLLCRGYKRTSNTRQTQNRKGEDNIISNGSVIAVNEGQCMIIVDQGKIAEVCAEAGEFIYDSSSEPSIFYGNFGKNILDTFKIFGRRISFGGDTAKDQRVYFINTKEILDNKFGTPNPVPFRAVDANIGLDLDTSIRCNGLYSYKVIDPILFYVNISGNVVQDYRKDQLDQQLKSEFLTALQPAFGAISAMGIRYSAITTETKKITEALNQELTESWVQKRGIAIVSVAINSMTLPPEDAAMISDLQKTAVFRNADMAAAKMTTAQADAMVAAASNTATGPMFAFAGMNMAQNTGGMNANELFAMSNGAKAAAQPNTAQAPAASEGGKAAVNGWTCACGVTENTGRFCTDCGAKKPEDAGWACACGAVNQGKFCHECGAKKPEGAPLYKCDQCGWEPKDPKNPPKFCPECGDIFDEKDVR